MLIAWWYVLYFLFQLVQLKTFSFFYQTVDNFI